MFEAFPGRLVSLLPYVKTENIANIQVLSLPEA